MSLEQHDFNVSIKTTSPPTSVGNAMATESSSEVQPNTNGVTMSTEQAAEETMTGPITGDASGPENEASNAPIHAPTDLAGRPDKVGVTSGPSKAQVERTISSSELATQRGADAGPGTIAQYISYLQLMQARVASLEHDLTLGKPVKENFDTAAITGDTGDVGKRIPAIPEIRRVKWPEFNNKVQGEKVYAIDVLVGEEMFWYQNAEVFKSRLKDASRTPQLPLYPRNDLNRRELSRRIRVNSIPVLKVFGDMVNSNWAVEPTIMYHPFKFLVFHESGIREYLERLEGKWGKVDQESALENTGHQDQVRPPRKTQHTKEEEQTRVSSNDQTLLRRAEGEEMKDQYGTEDRLSPRARNQDLVDSLETLRDLRCIVRFMDGDLFPTVANVQDFTRKQVSFRDLWYLFKPGDEIFIPRLRNAMEDQPSQPTEQLQRDSMQAQKRGGRYQQDWRVINCGGGRPILSPNDNTDATFCVPKQKVNAFLVVAFHIDFDGEKFRPVTHSFRIKPFEGEREITSLEFYPSAYISDHRQRREQLVARGLKFKEFRTFGHRKYKGTTFTCHPCGCAFDEDSLSTNSEPVDSHVVVDFAQAVQNDYEWGPDFTQISTSCYHRQELENAVPLMVWKDIEQRELDGQIFEHFNNELEDKSRVDRFEASHPLLREEPDPAIEYGGGLRDEDLILLPARVLAFAFRNRKFVALDIDCLQELKAYRRGWDDLKLPAGHKDMLKALVRTHLSDKEYRPTAGESSHTYDLVRGKGQGLVVLLHGVPGVGKTSTAECVAESNYKPLFPITCGDLGLTAASVEKALEDKFHLAQAWDCILLLDEADVFLEERTRQDIKRNSLVSVFLRVLEYYTGILFLTTNRVGAFDEAFKSRIHLALYFPPLKKKQTIAIWDMNLRRTLERKKGLMEADRDAILSFAESQFNEGKKTELHWNGRQIRNAFQTAAALAEFDANKDPGNGPVYSKLHTKHFAIVAQAAEQFDAYIKSVDQATPAERNLLNSMRNDLFRAEEIKFSRRDRDRATRNQPAAELYDNYAKEEMAQRTHPQWTQTSRRPQRARGPATDVYDDETSNMPPLQTQSAPQRRQHHTRPQLPQTAPSARPRRTHNNNYPTPTSSAAATSAQMEPDDRFYPAEFPVHEGERHISTPQRSLGTRASANKPRQPPPELEPEPESEEPDYGEEDSEGLE